MKRVDRDRRIRSARAVRDLQVQWCITGPQPILPLHDCISNLLRQYAGLLLCEQRYPSTDDIRYLSTIHIWRTSAPMSHTELMCWSLDSGQEIGKLGSVGLAM